MKKNFLIILTIAALNFSCETNKDKGSITVSEFYLVAEKDTVPCRVDLIYETTSIGYNNYLFIHVGAFLDKEFTNQNDTVISTSMSTIEMYYKDTLSLYYNKAGNYKISLEVNDQIFKEEIILFSKE